MTNPETQRVTSLVIVHFQPLELYPPVMNLIDYLAKKKELNVIVFTTKNSASGLRKEYSNLSANISIKRTAFASDGNTISRLTGYMRFYLVTFFQLCRIKPDSVLYFETISSWPAISYKKLRRRTRLLVHYHEYTSLDEYTKGMKLVEKQHSAEVKGYSSSLYNWISHTNDNRLDLFKTDYALQNADQALFHTMPNYPPQNWQSNLAKVIRSGEPARLVFVGALGYDTMYLKETVEWVGANPAHFNLDIYSHNISKVAKEFLDKNPRNNIRFHGGCDYQELPSILKEYDVGIVIYKPFNENTIHAVSNKVFEYLACGLDVWFSKDMTYTNAYIRENVFPKVLPVDFSDLSTFDFKKALSKEGVRFSPTEYFSENVYDELVVAITGNKRKEI